MKRLAMLAVTLLVTVLSARAVRAHIDTFGTPDPYWQNLARASGNGARQVPADGTAAVAGVGHPWALLAYLCTMGALLVTWAVRGVRRVLPELLWDLEDARTGGDTIRTVEVVPPSRRRESDLVLTTAAAIFLAALLFIAPGFGHGGADTGPDGRDLMPFQVLFRDAPPPVQRMYREIQEGLLEAERTRAASKEWPTVRTLAAQGIPPFDLARPSYRWSLVKDRIFVNYVGLPDPDGPAFLALLQEPDPDTPDTTPPSLPDEIHHRLADGTLLHVSIWFRDGAPAMPEGGPLTQPAAAGWTQVLVGQQTR